MSLAVFGLWILSFLVPSLSREPLISAPISMHASEIEQNPSWGQKSDKFRHKKGLKLLITTNSSEKSLKKPGPAKEIQTPPNKSHTLTRTERTKENTLGQNPSLEQNLSLGQSPALHPSEEMLFLRKFIPGKTNLEIHNKAMHFLKTKQKGPALLLLKRNVYQNFFPPSYFALFRLQSPISPAPLLWHIGMLLLGLICLTAFLLFFKKPQISRLKNCFWSLTFFGLLMCSGLFLLKKRVSPLQEVDLKSSPFMEAPGHTQLAPYSDLIVLKQTKGWLRVQGPDKQTGWLLKSRVFQIF